MSELRNFKQFHDMYWKFLVICLPRMNLSVNRLPMIYSSNIGAISDKDVPELFKTVHANILLAFHCLDGSQNNEKYILDNVEPIFEVIRSIIGYLVEYRASTTKKSFDKWYKQKTGYQEFCFDHSGWDILVSECKAKQNR